MYVHHGQYHKRIGLILLESLFFFVFFLSFWLKATAASCVLMGLRIEAKGEMVLTFLLFRLFPPRRVLKTRQGQCRDHRRCSRAFIHSQERVCLSLSVDTRLHRPLSPSSPPALPRGGIPPPPPPPSLRFLLALFLSLPFFSRAERTVALSTGASPSGPASFRSALTDSKRERERRWKYFSVFLLVVLLLFCFFS